MQGQGLPAQKGSRRTHRSITGTGIKALAVAVVAQAVADLWPRDECSTRSCVDAAHFLMDRLWQNDTVWGTLALDGNEWLTEKRVDQLVASKIAPQAVILLPPRLKQRLRHVNGNHPQNE